MKEIKISGLKFKHRNIEVLLTYMSVEKIRSIFYVFRRSKDDPEALQRKLVKRKVDDIKKSLEKKNVYFPNSIVVNIEIKENKKIQLKDDYFEFQYIYEENENTESDDIEERKGRIGYIIDGQHRIEGLRTEPNLKLPVLIFLQLDRNNSFKTFADINEKQEKVSKVLLNNIRWEIKDFLDDLQPTTYSIVLNLNSNQESPLYDKIRLYEEETGKWINEPALSKFVKKAIDENSPIHNEDIDKQTKHIINYLNAWKELYPTQWNEEFRQDFILTKSMGLNIMFRIFPRIYRRCQNIKDNTFTKEAFYNVLEFLPNTSIRVDDFILKLDWNSNNFGKFSSGKGINLIVKILLRNIREIGSILIDKDNIMSLGI